MKPIHLTLLLIFGLLWSCKVQDIKQTNADPSPDMVFKNKGHELVYQMSQKVGTYQALRSLEDVSYTYTYTTPDGKTDVSYEKYIFAGELSLGMYNRHERTLADLKGQIVQGYDGNSFWLTHNGKPVQDQEALKRVRFNRKTNFYWFAMFQKLLDPGLNYEYLKEKIIEGITYDVVKVSFDSDDNKPTDIYQLYINRSTQLVDQFLFTVVDFNVVDTPFLMKMEYEEVDGILIPSKRRYTQANWEGVNLNENWIYVRWTDIKFKNDFTVEQFKS